MKISLTFLFALGAVFAFSTPSTAAPRKVKKSKTTPPVATEVLSDPYGYGTVTHYTVFRGPSKITFSNPYYGHYTKAEITQRTPKGYRLIRFTLSKDKKQYLPLAIAERPYKTYHFHRSEPEICPPSSESVNPLSQIKDLSKSVESSVPRFEIREKLEKAGFFQASCYSPELGEDHKNAIMNAVASVLSSDSSSEGTSTPQYLSCLEAHGLSHESGQIKALIKQTLQKSEPQQKLSLSCSTDEKSRTVLKEKSFEISIAQEFRIQEGKYETLFFHELLHTIPLEDRTTPLKDIENCCLRGLQCDLLDQIAAQRRENEKKAAENATLTNQGAMAQAALGASQDNPRNPFSLVNQDHQGTCHLFPSSSQCQNITNAAINSCPATGAFSQNPSRSPWQREIAASFTNLLFPLAQAESSKTHKLCQVSVGTETTTAQALEEIDKRRGEITAQEVAAVQAPLSWETATARAKTNASSKKEVIPLNNDPIITAKPSRSIASISDDTDRPRPLPRPSLAKLASANLRDDQVSSLPRASRIVDTVERAADSVVKTVTFETLDSSKVVAKDAFQKLERNPSASSRLIIASLGFDMNQHRFEMADIKGLEKASFDNPFLRPSADKSQKDKSIQLTETQSAKEGQSPPTEILDTALTSAHSVGGTDTPNTRNFQKNSAFNLERKPSTTNEHTVNDKDGRNGKYTQMSYQELRQFLIGSYRQVAGAIENQDFNKALILNGIEIYDHENRKIGAIEPALVNGRKTHTVFIYSR